MEIIADSLDFQLNRETAIAIGKFDGVHVGHRRLLEEILEKKKEGLEALVFTFDVSPSVLFGLSDGKVLTTREEKRRIFRELGIDVLVEFPMTLDTASIPAEDFARRFLSGALCGRMIAAGKDLSFGKDGRGNAELLRGLSGELAFDVRTIPKVCIDGVEVSSTVIRSLVEQGKMEQAESFLGEPYQLEGTVVHGRHLGHSLGFPTINLVPPTDKLLPPYGVYLSKVRVGEELYQAITNIGIKPTVNGTSQLDNEARETAQAGAEAFLLDFDGDVYGREVQIYLHQFLRPERRFENVDALKEQIARDVAVCRAKYAESVKN